MPLETIHALLLFLISSAFTPGPNNMMIAASGANFGYRRSFPHILGVTFGFPAMLAAMALGLAQIFSTWPYLHAVLRYVGAAYMLYLAFRIATATGLGKIDETARPLGFLEAALFQWVNPKAVLFALSALATFTTPGGDFLTETTILTGLAILVSFSSITTWCLFGITIGRALRTSLHLRIFNLTMAALLVLSILLIFSD